MCAYKSDAGDFHLLIEKFVRICKCHHNILDQEQAYLDKMLKEVEGHVRDIKFERASLRAEKEEEKTILKEGTEVQTEP